MSGHTIPTISGRVANVVVTATAAFDQYNNIVENADNNVTPATAADGHDKEHETTYQCIQQKFKSNERVIAFFAGYQIVRQEDCNMLLALVESNQGGTYALFALSAAQLPPRTCHDLKIDKIFPLNDGFRWNNDPEGSIGKLTFTLKSGEDLAERYYYYHVNASSDGTDFETFYSIVISAVKSMPNSSVGLTDNMLSFSWLNEYRQIGDAKFELKQREHEYMVYEDYTVYCATWNINNRSDYESALDLWLSASEKPPDIYAIALQELDNSANAVARNEREVDKRWVHQMLQNVHRGDKYEHLTSVRLVGIMLTILVRKEVYSQISRHCIKIVPRGIFKTLGNKGGVAVSILLNEDRLCFINSHLAAHMANVDERNADYAGIVRNMIFDDGRTIDDHKHIFWIGDLNYRIDEKPGMEYNFNRADPDVAELLLYDQLKREMREGRCFHGYREPNIKFRPSYKYDVGTDNYDSSEKQRAPAYCDRILWKGAHIKPLSYNSVMELRQSDHKPVYAMFTMQVKKRDEIKYKRVHEEVLKLVDKRENENQPQITVEQKIIDFGLVRFNEMAVSDFTVSNSCPMIVDFQFKVKDPINDICEKWLKVEPRAGSLLPETSKNVRLKLMIDANSITEFLKHVRSSNYKMDFDILILNVVRGRDIFLTVTGEYKPSCFGLSVDTLCRTNRPLCEYNQEQLKDLLCDENTEYRITMPREYFFLIDYLYNQGANSQGLFSTLEYKHSKQMQFNEVCDWLDSWSDKEFPGTPSAAAEALIMLLNLPEKPLLHPYVEHLLCSNTNAEAKYHIERLSRPRRNVFMHLCMFLRHGIDQNYFNLQQVATVFGRVLLRNCSNNSLRDPVRDNRCRDFMIRFIQSEQHDAMSGSNNW